MPQEQAQTQEQEQDEPQSGLATWSSGASCTYNGDALSIHLELSFDSLLLLRSSRLVLSRGIVSSLVGVNGAGKSSLARAIASRQIPGFPHQLAIEYVSADDDGMDEPSISSMSPVDFMRAGLETKLDVLRKTIDELENADSGSESLEDAANRLAELYVSEEEIMSAAETEVHDLVEELNMTPHALKPLQSLSSGWRYKAKLAAAFLNRPDLIIIDEPSFLDDDSTTWLISRIRRAAAENQMVLFISHKESLLEAVSDQILYLNAASKSLSAYHCSYNVFVASHMEEVQHAEKVVHGHESKSMAADQSLKSVQSQLRRREKNFRAQTTQNADKRFIKGKNIESKQNADKAAASKVKQLQRQAEEMEDLKRQAQRERVKPIVIQGRPVDGNILASLVDVSFGYDDDDMIMEDVNVRLDPNDRVVISGPNGCGKSTMIKLLAGDLQPRSGTVIRRGKMLYFPQEALSNLIASHGSEIAVDFIADGSSNNLTKGQARSHLGNFGLTKELALRPVAALSAGQRVRLWLAKELLTVPEPSLLVFDEISENIDAETRKSILEVLNTFDGAVIVVSHDGDFRKSFHATHEWHLGPNGIRIS